MDAHEAPGGLLRERIQRQPARERGFGRLQLEAFLLPGGEPLQEELHAHLPLLLLLLMPLVKGCFLAQPEAVEEGTTHQGEGVLHRGDQGGALLLRGDRSEPLGRFPGALHHVEVPFQRRLRVQAQQLLLLEQMAVPGRRGVGQQAAQQGQGVAQGIARSGGFTVGPQQGGQFTAGVHASFDRQVEQQGFGLAQGKAQAALVMKHFGRAEHGQA